MSSGRAHSAVEFSTRPTAIDGLLIVTMRQATDSRGTAREFFRSSTLNAVEGAVLGPWRQINVTETQRGAIRGLHGEDMTKLVGVVHGQAFGAYVDVRPDSPTQGALVTCELVAGVQVLVPNGVCNGFQSISDEPTQYVYCFDAEWVPERARYAIHPLDRTLAIPWPIPVDGRPELLSERDTTAPSLREVLKGRVA
jgi:dTDP-4-dehydrorhamnose 3,5-epimerase